MSLTRSAVIVVLLLVPRLAWAQAPGYVFSRVTDGTGVVDGAEYAGYMEPAAVNSRGDILFAPGITTGEAVVLARHGTLTTISKGGTSMPDGGVLGYTLSPVSMNDNGDIAFIMTRNGFDLTSPFGRNAGLYRYNAHIGVVPAMLPGQPAPGGGSFHGASFVASISNRGDIAFPGMVCTGMTVSFATEPCPTGPGVLALGVYVSSADGSIRAVVQPGDTAPGGKHFDFARGPAINNRGDVAFAAHLAEDICDPLWPLCAESLYVKRAPRGTIESIAHHGDLSPITGKRYFAAFGPVMNATGDVVFLADLSPDGSLSEVAVLLYSKGQTRVIARPGETMPGGSNLLTAGNYVHDAAMNEAGDIVFVGTLANGDNGLYLWRQGALSLVAKTGTVIPGVGTISTLDDFYPPGFGNSQVAISAKGAILFAARMAGGGGDALLLATPSGR